MGTRGLFATLKILRPLMRALLSVSCVLCLGWVFNTFESSLLGNTAYAESGGHGSSSVKSRKSSSQKSKKHKKKSAAKKKTKAKKKELKAPVHGAGEQVEHKDFDKQYAHGSVIDAVLVLDASRSMQRTDPEKLRAEGAKLFVRMLSGEDRIAIIEFSREASVIYPLTKVAVGELPRIDESIERITVEGGFTDIQAGVEAASKILAAESRRDAVKAVVLLSDGRMDPHPSRGTAEFLVGHLENTDLPLMKQLGIRLYTLSLSEESDQQMLGRIAALTGGVHWFTPDAVSLHNKFSELVLTLKKPQVLPLEADGFRIDPEIREVTFYISRKAPDQEIVIIDPQRERIQHLSFPANVKWFKGQLFDVITVQQPLPGQWMVDGIDNPEGFATALTDIDLQVKWPDERIRLGDSALIVARLTEKGKLFSAPDLEKIIFYTYKIINSRSGSIYNSGSLVDNGTKGDQEAEDKIFSAAIEFEQEGDFTALVAVTGPTFTRQQHVSFNVSQGLIILVHEPSDRVTGDPARLLLSLGPEAMEMKKPKLEVTAVNAAHPGERISVKIKQREEEPGQYDVITGGLEPGEYIFRAALRGVTKDKEKVEAVSPEVKFPVSGGEEAEEEEEEAVDEGPGKGPLIGGIVSVVLSLAWAGGLFFYVNKTVKAQGSAEALKRDEYEVPEELKARVEALRAKTSTKLREPSDKDVERFALVKHVFGAAASRIQGKKNEEEKPAAEPEEAGEEGQAEEDSSASGEEEQGVSSGEEEESSTE